MTEVDDVDFNVDTETAKPVSVFQQLLDDYGQQFASRWTGIMGDNHIPRLLSFAAFFCNFYEADGHIISSRQSHMKRVESADVDLHIHDRHLH